MTNYAEELSKLTAREMRAAAGDPERSSDVLERLLSSAAFTIALMSGTDKKLTNELVTGAEGYLVEETARFSRLFGKTSS
jgi:hypothetical protein